MFFQKLNMKILNFNIDRKLLRRIFKPRWAYLLLENLSPISPRYGMNRGTPVDRYYISAFLSDYKESIHGTCLEIRDNRYSQQYADRIIKADILDIDMANKEANIHGDLQ